MISYTIIAQQVLDRLQKQAAQLTGDKAALVHANQCKKTQISHLAKEKSQLEHKVQHLKCQNIHLLANYKLASQKMLQMYNEFNHQQTRGKHLEQQLRAEKNQKLHNIKTSKRLSLQNNLLREQITELKQQIKSLRQSNHQLTSNHQSLQTQITQLNQIINQSELTNLQSIKVIAEKQQSIKNAQEQLNANIAILDALRVQNDELKSQRSLMVEQLMRFKQSPIPVLEEKLRNKQAWIKQLQKSVSELRHRVVQIQMHKAQHPGTANNHIHTPINGYIFGHSNHPVSKHPHKDYSPPLTYNNERAKYIAICRQLAEQFTTKLSRIQQQKKSLQQKYDSIRLKLNQYQYNEFRYRDKISLYIEKVERFENLTLKQQQQMQNLILEFDNEVNEMLKIKEDQLRTKFEQQLQRYQLELQQLKNSQQTLKEIQLKEQWSELAKRSVFKDQFEHQILKIQIQQLTKQKNKHQEELAQLKSQFNKLTVINQQLKSSLSKYKNKSLLLEEENQRLNSEIRRFKTIVRQLCHELEIKTNQIQILKHPKNDTNDDPNQNLSAKLSDHLTHKPSASELCEYQVSEIDTEKQRYNEHIINNLILTRLSYKDRLINTPAPNPYKSSQISDPSRRRNPAVNESMDSINHSQVSSISSVQQSPQHSQNSSLSSKNSYQSYGIKQLYTEKQKNHHTAARGLVHKNSLQQSSEKYFD